MVLVIVLVFGGVSFLLGKEVLTASSENKAPNYEARVKVERCLDGDTLEVEILEVSDPHEGIEPGKEKIRLAGIDTEETTQEKAAKKHEDVKTMSQEEYEETNYYREAIAAKEFVKSLVQPGDEIYLDIDDLAHGKGPYRGYFGRIIGVLYFKNEGNWVNLNAKLITGDYSSGPKKRIDLITSQYDSEFEPMGWLSEDYPYL